MGSVVVWAAAVAGGAVAGQAQEDSKEAEYWTGNNYAEICRAVYPQKPFERGTFPKELDWLVSVGRETDTGSTMLLTLEVLNSGAFRLTVLEPSGGTVGDQAIAIKRANPAATVAEVAGAIRMRQRVMSGKECPALARAARELRGLRLSPLPRVATAVHGKMYRILLEHIGGYHLDVVLHGIGGTKEPEPLAGWVERLVGAVERTCAE